VIGAPACGVGAAAGDKSALNVRFADAS